MVEDVEGVIEINAPREQVWRALTDPKLVAQWMGCLGFRALPGHVFHLQPNRERREKGDVTDAIACRIQILDAPRRLAFTWTFPETDDTHVSIRLTRIPGGTHVRLVHTGWEQFEEQETAAMREGLARAWHNVALPALRRVAEDSAG
jgi:uncharacterized protein YndB with AHSA1/START domain